MIHVLPLRWKSFQNPFLLLVALGVTFCTACGAASDTAETDATLEIPPDLPDPLEAGWEGKKVCEVVEDNTHHRILKCSFPPGVGHEQHYHAPHTGYTLVGGTFEITSANGTRTVTVPTGSVFGNEEVSVHEVLNVGETTAEFLIIEPKSHH